MDNDAVPPSSPPHAIATNPPSSPFFEPQRYRAFSPKSSSPPPLFSSDDSGETLDITNYESPRIFKNKRKGAWYETDNGDSTQHTPEPKKSKMSRNYDSGVYMMSDNSDGSIDPLPEHKSPFPFTAEADCHDDEPEPMSMTEAVFYSTLRAGVDRNCQNYDFRGLDLGDNDIKQIADLNSVIKNLPDPGNDLPAEGQYRSMVPELYINLGQNSLNRLTPSLFHLQHLTTLVLRDNQIEELPPKISQLRNLQELDLSLNKLQYLPFEILQMLEPHGKLEHLQTLGNPILERVSQARYRKLGERLVFTSSTKDMYPRLQTCQDREALVWHIRFIESMNHFLSSVESKYTSAKKAVDERVFPHHPIAPGRTDDSASARYIGRTLVSYFDQTGQPLKGSPARPSASSNDYVVIVDTDEGAFGVPSTPIFTPSTSSKIPSLLTMSLNTALVNITVEETRERIGEPVPFDAAAIFARAAHNDADAGFGYFHQCHVCNNDYIVARAEWIEFWSTSFTVFYPFRVKVCSWGCVPSDMTKKPTKELLW
ncbi:uncharacterized protein EKO05_0007989 [Ascochyta rabiei]|uniref:Uncharacterized protein n=1 Tax=Didymella rabiei TaxID=5454 RepID=A0A163B874_DIDRA|nr:uncharacterized protein EKO05_0007989 [Ascochyta rabiei]KZM21619.1 hypothetical protein ST47_g7261 [Ascochyta rabiei]UPX17648.1 hypothetical protein EKO05_0007989 [Ascochyta rabiei]